jgi:hypothetical protein
MEREESQRGRDKERVREIDGEGGDLERETHRDKKGYI